MKRTLVLCALSALIAVGGALATPAAGLGKSEAAKPNVVIDWNHQMLVALATAGIQERLGSASARSCRPLSSTR